MGKNEVTAAAAGGELKEEKMVKASYQSISTILNCTASALYTLNAG